MNDARISWSTRLRTLLAALPALLLTAAGAGAAGEPGLDVKPPAGWTVAGSGSGGVGLKPPPGSAFLDGQIFDVPVLFSPDVARLRPLAEAVYPVRSALGEQSGRRTMLDGYAAMELWGGATLDGKALSQATFFVWKGTRMIPVSVLVKGKETQAARDAAAAIARGVSLRSTATFFPVPGAPEGIVGPANWTPKKLKDRALNARVVAPDPEGEGPPGAIEYEILPASPVPALETVIAGLENLARSRGAERVRTSGVETKAGARTAVVFQQAVDGRLAITGAVIHYPEAALRVTYFDRPDRVPDRKAIFDQLVLRLAESDIKPPR